MTRFHSHPQSNTTAVQHTSPAHVWILFTPFLPRARRPRQHLSRFTHLLHGTRLPASHVCYPPRPSLSSTLCCVRAAVLLQSCTAAAPPRNSRGNHLKTSCADIGDLDLGDRVSSIGYSITKTVGCSGRCY